MRCSLGKGDWGSCAVQAVSSVSGTEQFIAQAGSPGLESHQPFVQVAQATEKLGGVEAVSFYPPLQAVQQQG